MTQLFHINRKTLQLSPSNASLDQMQEDRSSRDDCGRDKKRFFRLSKGLEASDRNPKRDHPY